MKKQKIKDMPGTYSNNCQSHNSDRFSKSSVFIISESSQPGLLDFLIATYFTQNRTSYTVLTITFQLLEVFRCNKEVRYTNIYFLSYFLITV